MSDAMRTTVTPGHTKAMFSIGQNIRQSGNEIGRSITKHCARYQLQSFSGYDSFTQSHTDGKEVNVSNPNASAHGKDSHASRGLSISRSSV